MTMLLGSLVCPILCDLNFFSLCLSINDDNALEDCSFLLDNLKEENMKNIYVKRKEFFDFSLIKNTRGKYIFIVEEKRKETELRVK